MRNPIFRCLRWAWCAWGPRQTRRRLVLFLGVIAVSGCAQRAPDAATRAAESPPVVPWGDWVLPVPFVEQLPDFCGEACVEMATAYFGARIPQRQVHRASGLRGPRGVHADELEATLRALRLPFSGGSVRRTTAENQPDHAADRAYLQGALRRGHPVLLGVWADPAAPQNPESWDFDHFALLVGYDAKRQVFFLHDPLGEPYRTVSWAEFARLRENQRGRFYSLELQGRP